MYESVGPISVSLRPGNTAPFEETSQRWRAVGNTVSDLTSPRFEPQTSRSKDEHVTARPTGLHINLLSDKINLFEIVNTHTQVISKTQDKKDFN